MATIFAVQPQRVAVGTFTSPNGRDVPVYMTLPWYRALEQLSKVTIPTGPDGMPITFDGLPPFQFGALTFTSGPDTLRRLLPEQLGYVLYDGGPGNAPYWAPPPDPSVGPRGAMGQVIFMQGEDGEDGFGIPGVSGVNGTSGTNGAPGQIVFMQGEDGEDGAAGPPGRNGDAGSAGSTGAAGPIGPAVFLVGDDGEEGQPGMTVVGPQGAAGSPLSINTQTASYTLVLADGNNVQVDMNVASANNLTVPPHSSVAFAVGTAILACQYGAGQTTVVAGAGVTLRNPSSLTTRARYSTIGLVQIASDEWVVSGDLT